VPSIAFPHCTCLPYHLLANTAAIPGLPTCSWHLMLCTFPICLAVQASRGNLTVFPWGTSCPLQSKRRLLHLLMRQSVGCCSGSTEKSRTVFLSLFCILWARKKKISKRQYWLKAKLLLKSDQSLLSISLGAVSIVASSALYQTRHCLPFFYYREGAVVYLLVTQNKLHVFLGRWYHQGHFFWKLCTDRHE
jgi:hypothetical protein